VTARDDLAARQAALVRALLAGGPVPDGFDARRVGVEATALRSKRRSVAAHLRPDLVDRLDDRFRSLFDTWAVAHPKPVDLSFRADLDRFEDWLYTFGHLEKPKRRRGFRLPGTSRDGR
jgi:hypothetical protein